MRPRPRPQDTRQFFAATLWRVATPVREVTWADFLLADFLTSLAKALSDVERAACHLLAGPAMQPHTAGQARRRLQPLALHQNPVRNFIVHLSWHACMHS